MDPLLGSLKNSEENDESSNTYDEELGNSGALSNMSDLPAPYGTRPAPVLQDQVEADDLDDGSDHAQEPVTTDPTTPRASNSKLPHIMSLPPRTRSSGARLIGGASEHELRGSFIDALRREGLATINSDRSLIRPDQGSAGSVTADANYASGTYDSPTTTTNLQHSASTPLRSSAGARLITTSTDILSAASLQRIDFARQPNTPVTKRPSFLTSKLISARLKKSRFAHQGKSPSDLNYVEEPSEPIKADAMRRFNPGQLVLVNNQTLGWMRLVNAYGFPPGSGESVDERSGPYQFVLASVKEVHFDEVQPYYTVTIIHSGVEERANGEYMHSIPTLEGEQAAIRAATEEIDQDELNDELGAAGQADNEHELGICDHLAFCILSVLVPFVWTYDVLMHVGRKHVLPLGRFVLEVARAQGTLVLDGKKPYRCPMRFTIVNFVVLCSVWFVFMDMIRLALLPSSLDDAIAQVDLFVWIVLMLELLFQIFIRPDGFNNLILSDKAYSPTTIRYISWFHLSIELISMLLFIPEFICVLPNQFSCSQALPFSLHRALLRGIIGPTRLQAFFGHAYIALVRLRVFGLIRHWRNMWITNTFVTMKWAGHHTAGLRALIPLKTGKNAREKKALLAKKKLTTEQLEQRRKDSVLTNASTIGTALMATNSYRALGLYWFIFGLFPVMYCISQSFINPLGYEMTNLLEQTNLMANDNAAETCQFLGSSIWAWITSVAMQSGEKGRYKDPYLMTMEIAPNRCSFQGENGTLRQYCKTVQDLGIPQSTLALPSWSAERLEVFQTLCQAWSKTWGAPDKSPESIATATNKRIGSIMPYSSINSSNLTLYEVGGISTIENANYSVTAVFDATLSIELAASSCLLSQICLLFVVLGGLSVLRRDAEVLVLDPLRRMLKKVAQYAKNPLAQPHARHSISQSQYSDSDTSTSSDSSGDGERELGSFETERLITAVNKITDLLRKCWGVAGADIISTNLAAREGALEVFNPTVPGKSVYALFGFAYINDFDHILMSLQDDVMILINDVAAVLHGEVFRWGFGDSGQCNKNLGAAFLMVFRIGLVNEVIEKLEQATDVIFSTSKGTTTQGAAANRSHRSHQRICSQVNSNRNSQESNRSVGSSGRDDMSTGSSHMRTKRTRALKKKREIDPKTLSLQSLPGISTFTDRAVIGMLKAFAGVHRDNKIRNWNNDFRLSAGVGAFEVSMIFGMDAGWAVEGAVGSEYKIDATYLSPHVNMASRMMMASKQYGVKIMLSQSVQELMSDVANTKLRHLDTVTVKGSSVKQRIYTYDARAQGVDFFLFSRTDEQADYDAEKYTPRIWDTDQDLLSMRQHVSEHFLTVYNRGHKAYIQGDWEKALPLLERANEIMVETALEEGYLEDQFEALEMQSGDDAKAAEEELKRMNGDGPSLYLVAFIKSFGGKAPDDWEGWHPLTRK
ncbi:hypothetical protein MPSEU_000143800 [Mayamaea pseudoterrestris]|nr:hypothetical protein MPSEU_000143800 [Mayamaea pseudoterrestris]